jgi:peptide/nickel transport system substrate-binding protein
MRTPYRFLLALSVASLLVSACTAAGTTSTPSSGEPQSPATPKRIVAGVFGTPFTTSTLLAAGGTGTSSPGTNQIEKLVNVGFTDEDDQGLRVPRLAEATPTTENGLWKVLPDGRTEMTFTLRPGIRWHDGTPFTSSDAVFTAEVGRDRNLPIVRPELYGFVDRIEAPDLRTVVVYWKEPYILADTIFGSGGGLPLPKHLLDEARKDTPQNFTALPYWSGQYVGVGPYRIKDWVEGSHVVVEANPEYTLGRPKLDQIEVRFIPSPPTMLANILAGSVELTMDRGMSLELGDELERQWRDGRVNYALGGAPLSLRSQHLNPDPPLLAEIPFRRALYHGLNRQLLSDSLLVGKGRVAHHPVAPGDAMFDAAEAAAVRYDFDPRRSTQILEGMGLSRGADGFYRTATGQTIAVELRGGEGDDIQKKGILTAADMWRQIGISADPVIVPNARQRDLEYRANFPGFEIGNTGSGLADIRYLRASELRTAANNNFQGRNRNGYTNPELEALADRYQVTVNLRDRAQIVGQMTQHLTDRVIIMYLVHDGDAAAVSNRLLNVSPSRTTLAWNAHEWDVR